MTTELFKQISPNFTEEYLCQVIEEKNNIKNFKITSLISGEEGKKGDSYMSAVTKFTLHGTGKNKCDEKEASFTIPMITKFFVKNVARRKTFRSTDFFRNEAKFYNHVWPSLQKFQTMKKPKQSFMNIPQCYAAYTDGANDFIALEDLSYRDYKAPIRQEDLDQHHTMLILRVFAQFHALSLAFKDENYTKFKEIVSNLKETYVAEEFRDYYTKFQKSLFAVVRDAIEKNLSQFYLEKFDAMISGDFYGEMIALCTTETPLSVVTHGDAWVPNFLMKYSKDGQPKEAMMIDFQLTRYAPLSQDILFFLFSCTSKELRDKHFDHFIRYYHSEFTKMLEDLGSSSDLLTYDALMDDIKRNAKFGIGMAIEAIPMSLLDEHEVPNLDSIQGTNAVPIDTVLIVRPFTDETKTRRLAEFFQDVVDRKLI